jgi:uncharacterized protein (DUF2384 family)
MALAYPSSNFTSPPVADLNSKADRERLSRSALRGFFRIVERWSVRDEDARELLGGLSSSAYYDWKKNPDRVLDVDRITRISYLTGIYKALHILYGEKLADDWVNRPNTNALFGAKTPLAYMIGGGLLAMQTVRRLLDARRGG